MGKKIILDCDPGHDDAVAILLALGNPAIDLLGVTTVGGNQSLDKVTYNARAVLEKAHATDVPVHMGCGRPLIREPEAAATIHGQSGCFASMSFQQAHQYFSAVWADGFPRSRHHAVSDVR